MKLSRKKFCEKCPFCNDIYHNRYFLNEHIKNKHKKDNYYFDTDNKLVHTMELTQFFRS